MWLINTETLKLEHFTNPPTQPASSGYAILSHTWEAEEVSFQLWQSGEHLDSAGHRKVTEFVKLAKSRGFSYAWADTCCINKESSAELSEAINSMFRYYEKSTECYVYLCDMPCTKAFLDAPSGPQRDIMLGNFTKCKWFTRGWTLQELIAPSQILFFDQNWQTFGDKKELSMPIFGFTQIPRAVLLGFTTAHHYSIATRMSWAATRRTTRIEDKAYCLLGIFGIHMPMLYGEGKEAFIRLQEEICKRTTDLSLFAWTSSRSTNHNIYSGLLAGAPSDFIGLSEVKTEASLQTGYRDDIAITNRGIRFDPIRLHAAKYEGILLDLQSRIRGGLETSYLFVRLVRRRENWVRCGQLVRMPAVHRDRLKQLEPERIYVLKSASGIGLPDLDSVGDSRDKLYLTLGAGLEVTAAEPSHLWDQHYMCFLTSPDFLGIVEIKAVSSRTHFLLVCQPNREMLIGQGVWPYDFFAIGPQQLAFTELQDLVYKKKLRSKNGTDEATLYTTMYKNEPGFDQARTVGVGLRDAIQIEASVPIGFQSVWDAQTKLSLALAVSLCPLPAPNDAFLPTYC